MLLSVGNGVSSFELSDNVFGSTYDFDGSLTITGRLEVIPMFKNVRLGLSYSHGGLRTGQDEDISVSDPRRFGASFEAYGVHANLDNYKGMSTNAYLYWSNENLEDNANTTLSRYGFTFEPSYRLSVNRKKLQAIVIKTRYSFSREDRLDGSSPERYQLGGGLNFVLNSYFATKFEYVSNIERDSARVSNSGFSMGLVMSY